MLTFSLAAWPKEDKIDLEIHIVGNQIVKKKFYDQAKFASLSKCAFQNFNWRRAETPGNAHAFCRQAF